MGSFRVQVNYIRGAGEKWSNVWNCVATDMASAIADWSGVGAPDLLPLLDSSCQLKSLLVSDNDSDAFATVDLNLAGTSSASGDLLPLFNSAKVLFPDTSFGRPDLKYFKGFVTESIQTAGNLNSGTITAVNGLVATLISDMAAAGTTLGTKTGDAYTTATTQVAVQMRQMHRKRRKTV